MVTRADGVGPKLAQRVVMELAEKVGALPTAGMQVMTGATGSGNSSAGDMAGSVIGDAMSALENLGYGRAEAHAAIGRARADGADGDDLSTLIAAALQQLGR